MSRPVLMESLEARAHPSVNLAAMIGPLKSGSVYKCDLTHSNGVRFASEVDTVSATKYKGKSVVAISGKTTLTKTGSAYTRTQYLNLTSAGVTVLADKTVSKTSTITKTYAPPLIKLPTTAVAGHTYTYYYTSYVEVVDSKGRKTTISDSFQDKVKLLNNKAFKLSVNGRKYTVYEVSLDETSATYGATHVEMWFSPDIGLVQSTSAEGTAKLTSFTG